MLDPSLTPFLDVLPYRVWLLVALAGILLLLGMISWMRAKRNAARHAERSLERGSARTRSSTATSSDTEFSVFGDGKHVQVFACKAELVERRPLSEAQWDSEVPAAWTIFKLSPADNERTAFNLGLLLPIQEPKAFSSGYLERLDGSDPDPLLRGFSRALAGPVPGAAISGSEGGFMEFKMYVDNERPTVIPGSMDSQDADYWIYVKVFVQDVLEFFMRVNAAQGRAEIATGNPAQGEELLRVIAATLRPAA
ncbi:MAG: hypothetical protein FJX76_19220 [Armatimonadetes bacterium]|nr:hypothetical protein [Armatimonadota bacterium]